MKSFRRRRKLSWVQLRLCLIVAVAGVFAELSASPCLGAQKTKTKAAAAKSEESDEWMFDNSAYTNDPKTGHRVDQYKKEKTPYRDPNALFDSPMDMFGFCGGYFGGFYDSYSPINYFNQLSELMGNYFYGSDTDSDKYYPYDGDPNDREDDNMQ
jgi:hypothetical protein